MDHAAAQELNGVEDVDEGSAGSLDAPHNRGAAGLGILEQLRPPKRFYRGFVAWVTSPNITFLENCGEKRVALQLSGPEFAAGLDAPRVP